jgi:HEAT repeat protein
MFERARWIARSRDLLKSWFEPQRRAAFIALIKASLLMGALSELGWLLNTRYFSKRFPQLPISLAWSMLTVIFLVTAMEAICSVVMKLRSERRRRLSAEASRELTALLARYISGENVPQEITRAAKDSPEDLEKCIATALLSLRGSALRRLCELPETVKLRDRWAARSRKGDDNERRYAVEQLGLLRDPATIPALEKALKDSFGAVQAAAIRGLLQMPSYGKHDELICSLPRRSYLVRVLTACESADFVSDARMPGTRHGEFQGAGPVELESLLRLASAISPVTESANVARASCLALAALGATGLDSLRLMSAAGEAGDAPAEALGASLSAGARGGRT